MLENEQNCEQRVLTGGMITRLVDGVPVDTETPESDCRILTANFSKSMDCFFPDCTQAECPIGQGYYPVKSSKESKS